MAATTPMASQRKEDFCMTMEVAKASAYFRRCAQRDQLNQLFLRGLASTSGPGPLPAAGMTSVTFCRFAG